MKCADLRVRLFVRQPLQWWMIVDYDEAAPYLKLIRFGLIKSNHSNHSNHQRSNQIIQIYMEGILIGRDTQCFEHSVEETHKRSASPENA